MSVTEYVGYAKCVNREKVMLAIRNLLLAIGEDPGREGLQETPRRVADMYMRNMCGNNDGPRLTKFTARSDGIIARKCDFLSTCEHHLVPFGGVAYIAYVPNKQIIGMDKIDLVVDWVSSRLQLQENIAIEVADILVKELDPQGVLIKTAGVHFCARYKGNSGSFAYTEARGIFKSSPEMEMKAENSFKALDTVRIE